MHHDVKCENVLVGEAPTSDRVDVVLLTDLGLSHQYGPSERGTVFCGSPGFFPPEIADLPADYDPTKVDVWSVGAVALELVAGKQFFSDEWLPRYKDMDAPAALTTAIDAGLASLGDDLVQRCGASTAAADFVRSALRRDPGSRPDVGGLVRHAWIADLVPAPPPPAGVDRDDRPTFDSRLSASTLDRDDALDEPSTPPRRDGPPRTSSFSLAPASQYYDAACPASPTSPLSPSTLNVDLAQRSGSGSPPPGRGESVRPTSPEAKTKRYGLLSRFRRQALPLVSYADADHAKAKQGHHDSPIAFALGAMTLKFNDATATSKRRGGVCGPADSPTSTLAKTLADTAATLFNTAIFLTDASNASAHRRATRALETLEAASKRATAAADALVAAAAQTPTIPKKRHFMPAVVSKPN